MSFPFSQDKHAQNSGVDCDFQAEVGSRPANRQPLSSLDSQGFCMALPHCISGGISGLVKLPSSRVDTYSWAVPSWTLLAQVMNEHPSELPDFDRRWGIPLGKISPAIEVT